MLTAFVIENMNVDNPFQIPTCFKLDIEQRRRERFKKTVVTAVIVSIAVVIGLLIEGCVSERSETSVSQNSAPSQAVQSPEPQTLPEQQQYQSAPKTTPSLQPCPVAMVPKKAVSPANPHPTTGETVYSVKAGDSLSRIAKTHHITVKALKSVNNLATDRINIGEQLKIPSA